MRVLNIGCGGFRPQDECYWNLDNLRTQLALGTPERANLDSEPRYVEHDLKDPLPFENDFFDACAMVHVLEHLPCHTAVAVLKECRRVTKTGGVVFASVPDSAYFLDVYGLDRKETAEKLFGEPIHDAGHEKFFTYALFRHDHLQILNDDSLKCLFLAAGFDMDRIGFLPKDEINNAAAVLALLQPFISSRRVFSSRLMGLVGPK